MMEKMECEFVMYMDYDVLKIKACGISYSVRTEIATKEELHFLETGEKGNIEEDNSGYDPGLGSWIIIRDEERKEKIMVELENEI